MLSNPVKSLEALGTVSNQEFGGTVLKTASSPAVPSGTCNSFQSRVPVSTSHNGDYTHVEIKQHDGNKASNSLKDYSWLLWTANNKYYFGIGFP